MLWIFTLVVLVLSVPTHEQETPLSPCPSVFEYKPPGKEQGKWEGVITLTTNTPLLTVFLTIVLDNKAELLGNWLGEVSTQDNKEFRIESTETAIHPGRPVKVEFYVKFNIVKPTPLLRKIRLHGVEICNADIPQPAVGRVTVEVPTPPVTITMAPVTQTTATVPRTTERPPTPSLQTNAPPSLIPIDFETNPVPGHEIRDDNPGPVFKQTTTHHAIPSRVDGGSGENDNNIPENPQPSVTRQDRCGAVVFGNPLVVNGTPTQEGDWPWQVALYHTEYVDNKYICGGTLVSHLHVITAAHCVTLKDSRQIGNKATYSVFLGKHNLMSSVRGVEFRYLNNIMIHEEYDPSALLKDIAILEMQRRVEYSSWIQPACLWPENLIPLNNVIGRVGTVVGWGYNGKTETAVELLKVGMPVVDPLVCLQSFPTFFERFITDYTYCAGFRNGSAACNGDSGGGMMFQLGEAWYLRGLVSLSVARRAEQLCNPSHFIIFTDVAKFLPWIKGIVYDF